MRKTNDPAVFPAARNAQKRSLRVALLWVLLAALALAGATYAWFSFNQATNVEPMSGAVSAGDADLRIANTREGPFEVSCVLTPDALPETLHPVSTASLDRFYAVTAQDRNGLALLYRDVTDTQDELLIRGTVYLQCRYAACNVYLNAAGLSFGENVDAQALAALRLGLRITTQSGEAVYLLRLDELAASTAALAATQTVPTPGTVVEALAVGGTAQYTADPADPLSAYSVSDAGEVENASPLATLAADEIASVEYWLYLEGCDEHCVNEVQGSGFGLQLAFAGFGIT
jgi:hypothetical protein